MNYYPFHIGDYISHTSHLSDAEDLAYRRLIDLYYQTEKPFKHNLNWLSRKIKSTPEIVDLILNEFFEFENDQWHSKRADEEISKYQAKADSARNANRIKSAKISSLKSELKSEPLQIVTNNQEPITNNHNIKTNPIAPKVAIPIGVSEDLWKDFLTLRKAKKLAVTQTALKGIVRESQKANISLEEALTICCERGWGGFKAEWLDAKQTPKNNTQEWRTNDGLMMAKAQELGLHTQGLQRYELIQKIDNTLRSRGL